MLSSLRATLRLVPKPAQTPRIFATTGYEVLASSQPIEEENWEWYKPQEFYPVRIGEIFQSRYQVVGKLGYGAFATAWLCRDLSKRKHVALKVGTPAALEEELQALRHLETVHTGHIGASLVRRMLDEFQLESSHGLFQCIVHPPLALTLDSFRMLSRQQAVPVDFIKAILKHVFLAVDFLHSEAKVIHTDIQESNIMLGMSEKNAAQDLDRFEKQELESLSARKIDGDRIIYTSRRLVPPKYDYGRPMLCDFGQARLMSHYDAMVDIQPYQYRAPEVIFNIPWNEKVDIWSIGAMTWDMLGNGNLFRTTGGPDDKQDNIYHLANMIALLGRPPKDFLDRTQGKRVQIWFDEQGEWKNAAEVPSGTLESLEKKVRPAERDLFFNFMRRMLRWKPEERSSARELLDDPWLSCGEA